MISKLSSEQKPLTRKQQEIFDFIVGEKLRKGYPPTVREICKAVNLKSTSSAQQYLGLLEKKGFIRRDPSKPRAIEILIKQENKPQCNTVNVPVIKNIKSDGTLLNEDNIERYFPVPSEYLRTNHTFMFKAKDNSMIHSGIKFGDLVLIKQTKDIQNGDIVVSLSGDLFEFRSPVDEIAGKVIGVMRFL